jgi:hypothetical protein
MKKLRTNWKAKYHREVIRRMALEGQLLRAQEAQKQLKLVREQIDAWSKGR